VISSRVFELLLSESPPGGYFLHNVTLLAVTAGDDGYERLDVECGGECTQLRGCQRWDPELSMRQVGLVGCLKPGWEPINAPGSRFLPYPDQTLRRVEDLDGLDEAAERAGRRPSVSGWRCAARPAGFRAPAGLIPGMNGNFVPDNSVELAIRIPNEFVELSHLYRMTPTQLLQSFVADVCDLRNVTSHPRADGRARQGSDESDLAEQWLDRAFGYRLNEDDDPGAESYSTDVLSGGAQ